jgi:hypothetical protein
MLLAFIPKIAGDQLDVVKAVSFLSLERMK